METRDLAYDTYRDLLIGSGEDAVVVVESTPEVVASPEEKMSPAKKVSPVKRVSPVKIVSPKKNAVVESTKEEEEEEKQDDNLTVKSHTTTIEKVQITPENFEKNVKPLCDLAKSCDLMCHADMIRLRGLQFEERHQFESQDSADAVLCRSRGQHICESLTKLNLGGEDRDFTLRTSQESRWSRYDRILGHAKGGIRDYPCHNLLRSLRVRSNVATDIMPSLRRICTLQEEKNRLEALLGDNVDSGRRRLRRRRRSGPVHYLDLPNVGVYLTESYKKWLVSPVYI